MFLKALLWLSPDLNHYNCKLWICGQMWTFSDIQEDQEQCCRDSTAQGRGQQPFKADLSLCMGNYVPNDVLNVPVTKAASERQGLPLVCLSGVGDLNPSWLWSWVGVRSYFHSQTLLLGCSSSQSLACAWATENLLCTGFLSHAVGDQVTELSWRMSNCWDYLRLVPLGILLSSWRLQASVKRGLTNGN